MKQDLNLVEEETLEDMYFHSKHNDFSLRYSDNCGCFKCLEKFKPKLITEWAGEDKDTAVCPKCGAQSVVPSAAGTITVERLRKLNKRRV